MRFNLLALQSGVCVDEVERGGRLRVSLICGCSLCTCKWVGFDLLALQSDLCVDEVERAGR